MRVSLPAAAIMVVVTVSVVIAIVAAMVVPVIVPVIAVAVPPARAVAIIVTVRAAIVVAVAHTTYIVPIARHPIAGIVIAIYPGVSRAGARRNVGRISNAHRNPPLGCFSRVGSEHHTACQNCCSEYPFTYVLHKYLRPSGL
jgi:hypothetical protein